MRVAIDVMVGVLIVARNDSREIDSGSSCYQAYNLSRPVKGLGKGGGDDDDRFEGETSRGRSNQRGFITM